jgi:hypothetical protein
MSDVMRFTDSAMGTIHRPGKLLKDNLNFQGSWLIDHYRAGRQIGQHYIPNLVLNAAKNANLDTFFNGSGQLTSWYVGLINNSGFTSIVASDTIASHAGWSELTTQYSQGTRPAWGQGAASAQIITNASPIVFSMVTTVTVQGLIIVSQSTKGGTSGLMWSAASFPTPLPTVNLDELRCTYNLAT